MRRIILWVIIMVVGLFVAEYFINKVIEEVGGIHQLLVSLLILAGLYSWMNEQ